MEFLELKEVSKIKGNMNTLTDIIKNYKFNFSDEKYKTNKHILVQEIKKDAEQSMLLYREQIIEKSKKRTFIHGDQDIKMILKKVKMLFKNYQLSLYLYSFSAFLEVMLLENFTSGYLDSVQNSIEEYSYQYRRLYTDIYNLMEKYFKTSIQSEMITGISFVSKSIGEVFSKVPLISKSQIDENLIEAGKKLELHSEKNTIKTLEEFAKEQSSVVMPFIDNIKMINELYNKPTEYLFDNKNIYICKK